MINRILRLPLMVVLMGIGAICMYVPALHAATVRDFEVMRVFFQSANLLLIVTAMIAVATSDRHIKNQSRSYLLGLVAAYCVLPLFLAVPVAISVPSVTFIDAYVEMVSDLSTTGITLFAEPSQLPPSIHLWRAMVGWLGGLLILIAALAILAPMRLGGFEVLSKDRTGFAKVGQFSGVDPMDGSRRLLRSVTKIAPIYVGLTAVLWVALLVLGDPPLVAISHAMSTLATSGISPIGGLGESASGFFGEALIFLLFLGAISHVFLASGNGYSLLLRFWDDPEIRLALFLIGTLTIFFVGVHWFLDTGIGGRTDFTALFHAFWGALFTSLSFLSTTGFESNFWSEAWQWSGLKTPGIILMGLALTGGGVATTAGGIKLLRIYVLYRHGSREMDRLVFPSSVGGTGNDAKSLQRSGGFAAFIFFMLFGLSLAFTVIAFALIGLDFSAASTLAVACLSTTGPVIGLIGEVPLDMGELAFPAKLVMVLAMVLGRLETLAIVALFNPDFWRK